MIYIYFIYSSLTFLNISRTPPNCGLLFPSGYSIHLMTLLQNTSGSTDPDSLNQLPFTGHHTTSSTTTTATSSTTTTTTSSTTSTSSRVFPTITSPSCTVGSPMSPNLQGGKYSSSSNSSHPAVGENISPGFTARDQGLRMGVETARDTSGGKVNVMCTFQQMFENAKIAFDRINFFFIFTHR